MRPPRRSIKRSGTPFSAWRRFLNSKRGDVNPGGEEAVKIVDRLEVLQGQLIFLENLIKGLDGEYKKFRAAHPE